MTMSSVVLITAPHVKATQYEPYLAIVSNAINGNAVAGTSITRLVLHNISTAHNLSDTLALIQQAYPKLQALSLRWLTTQEQRSDKRNSSIVLTIKGLKNINDLGAKHVFIHGNRCTIAPYHNFTFTTRCTRCLEMGHTSPLCKAEHLTCAVCAKQHTTAKHPCKIPRCKGGRSCSHAPLVCKVCGPGYRFGESRNCADKPTPSEDEEIAQ